MLPKDAADQLGIAKPTLRKWAAEFAPWLSADAAQPGAGQDRRYSDSDIATLQRAQQLLAQRYSYAQVRDRLGARQVHEGESASATAPERTATALGEQVVILDPQPEIAALRQLLDAQRETLEAQQMIVASQSQVIEAQRAQLDALELGLDQARADEAMALAELRRMIGKIPRWLRALLGLGV